jgi:uncharacterized protein YdiU (UPF0061 family)
MVAPPLRSLASQPRKRSLASQPRKRSLAAQPRKRALPVRPRSYACAMLQWRLDNTYARLLDRLFSRVMPAKVRDPRCVIANLALAEELGLDLRALTEQELASALAGQVLPEGADPIAQAYAGHQFGGFAMLGDGRAILLGEHITPRGKRVDVQLKGSGQTPYSRRGDGLAVLGPMLREHIMGEAMHALGIPTSRSLAVVTTGEPVLRESVRRGAILVRVASSHIRVGTFQYAAAVGDHNALKALADYAISRHYPELGARDSRYLDFLHAVIARQASLIARWQSVGFIHGVMNTDNMAISGETIDYGPCAFMDAYHPGTVFSSIDHHGRYAYGNQPSVARWNLARFAETLLPLISGDEAKAIAAATEALQRFSATYERHWLAHMRARLDLRTEQPGDAALVQSLLDWMQESEGDYTLTLRNIGDLRCEDETIAAWRARWQARLRDEPASTAEERLYRMRHASPAVIPRNYRVEEALEAAEERDDCAPLHELLDALAHPFDDAADRSKFAAPPPPSFCGYRTFCGT